MYNSVYSFVTGYSPNRTAAVYLKFPTDIFISRPNDFCQLVST